MPCLACSPRRCCLRRGACLLCRLPALPLACFPAPYPPSPLPRRGRGRPRLFYARGFAPCIPGIRPPAALTEPAKRVPGGGLAFFAVCLPPSVYFPAPYPPVPLPRRGRGSPRLFHARGFAPCIPGVEPAVAAKPTEFLYLEQCRQPRRGGTGGEELRRLRWSSPPGQVEQMPHGERSPAPPLGGTGAGGVSRAGGGDCPAAAVPGGRVVPPALPARPAGAIPGGGRGREVRQRRGLAGGKGGKLPPL